MITHHEFKSQNLNQNGKAKADEIQEGFDALLTKVLQINPASSREMSICRTHLEEACFFAIRAMASTPGNAGA